MPKIVDHAARRVELAEAFWSVALRRGVEAASVRAVAREAGRSPAALRYYFPEHTQLLDFTWTRVLDRALERARSLDLPDSPVEAALLQLEQSLPLDAERMGEAQLWFRIASRSPTDEQLRARVRQVHDILHDGCADIVAHLAEQGCVAPDRDLDEEATRLHALLDGLSFQTVMNPDGSPPARVRAALRGQLRGLAVAIGDS